MRSCYAVFALSLAVASAAAAAEPKIRPTT